MEKDNIIEFVIDVGMILSFNEYLKAGVKKGKTGKYYGFLYMNPDVRNYKLRIKEFIIKNYKELILETEWFKKSSKFNIDWHYEVDSIAKMDVSNIHKIVEDSIFDAINKIIKPKKRKVNDVQVMKCTMEKSNKVGERQIIRCRISLRS